MTDTLITVTKRRVVLLSGGIMLALLVIGLVIWGYFITPSHYISLDVNPSIEIQTNRLNQVVSINPVNDDAKQLLAGYQLTDKNLEVVIKNIVDRMIFNGYLAPDKDNKVLITTDKKAAAGLEKNLSGILSAYLEEKQLKATLLHQSIEFDRKEIKDAHKNNISAGKMKIITRLIQGDPTLTVEELAQVRLSDLIDLSGTENINIKVLSKENGANKDYNIIDADEDDDKDDVDDDKDDADDDKDDADDDKDDADDDKDDVDDDKDDVYDDKDDADDDKDDSNDQDKDDDDDDKDDSDDQDKDDTN